MHFEQWVALLQVVLLAGVALVGVLVESHRKVGSKERGEIRGQLQQVMEQLELAVGDLRRQSKGR
jgi:hypothetical protein